MRVRSAATDPDTEESTPCDWLITYDCCTKLLQKWDEMLRDGFMETGDVMEQRGPSTVVWIDRKKNIMKLSQVHVQLLSSTVKLRAWHPCLTVTALRLCKGALAMGVLHG